MPMRPSAIRRRIVRSERTTPRFYEPRAAKPLCRLCVKLSLARGRRRLSAGRTAVRSPLRCRCFPTNRAERALSSSAGSGTAQEASTAWRPHRRPAGGGRVGRARCPASRYRFRAFRVPSSGRTRASDSRIGVRPETASVEVRGVHVTMALASLPGKLEEYVDLERDGLTAIELDIKDENGEVGFADGAPALARKVGAAGLLLREGCGEARSWPRAVPHRPHRRLRRPGSLARAARPRCTAQQRLGMGRQRRARLDEPVRPAGLGLQRRHRRSCRAWRIRRDHVRLRAVPLRR